MVQLWRSFGGLVPLLGLVVIGLAVLLPMIRRSSRQRRRFIINALLVGWSLGVAAVTLSPAAGQRGRAVEAIPLMSIADLVTNSVDWQVPAAQIGGNVLLFVPLGILLMANAQSGSLPAGIRRGCLVAAVVAVVIEVAQYMLGFGRVASVDDIILAVIGTAAGTLIAAVVTRRLRPAGTRKPVVRSLPN
ncbi:VanZ family protein [Kribbella sp. NPDC056861]|uniref:VanZ family protein n=1 Tax=Kribbella sp. NPDC056861 TaxID=3154857 RepID=UPI00343AD366